MASIILEDCSLDLPIYGTGYLGQWYCIEAHMKLNDHGKSNGVLESWINGTLDAQRTGLNFAGPYSDDWQTGDEEPSAFEPCGKQRHLVIDTALTLHPGTSAPAETSIIAMDSTDATVKTTYRLLWKSCTVGHLNRVAP